MKKSTNASSKLDQSNFGLVRDNHKQGAEHTLKKDDTRFYDAAFLGTDSAVINPSYQDTAREYDSEFFGRDKAETKTSEITIDELREDTAQVVSEAVENIFVSPKKLEKGHHFIVEQLSNGMEVGMSFYSNSDIKDLSPEQKAKIGVGSFIGNSTGLSGKILELNLTSAEDKKVLTKVFQKSLEKGSLNKLVFRSSGKKVEELANQMTLDVNVKEKLVSCSSSKIGPRCYLIHGKHVTEISNVKDYVVESGDILFAANTTILEALVKNIAPVNSSQDAGEFFKQEAANQVHGLVQDAMASSVFSLETLNESISKIIQKVDKTDPGKEILSTSFIACEIP